MTLKELIRTEFDADLPISGGYGSSFEDAIIIHQSDEDFVAMEYFIVKCLAQSRELIVNSLKQSLYFKEEKKYDILLFETIDLKKLRCANEEFYFDITECFGT